MATSTVASTQDYGQSQKATGVITSDGGIATVTCGFKPRRIFVFNETDAISWEWIEGFAATISLKTLANGTQSADTTTAVTQSSTGFVLSAAAAGTAKKLTWMAE